MQKVVSRQCWNWRLPLCHGLISKNEQWVGDGVLGPAPDLQVSVLVIGPVHSLLWAFMSTSAKWGVGMRSLLLFPQKQHHRWVQAGQLQKDSRETIVGDLRLLYCSGAGREQTWPALNPPTHRPVAWTLGNIFWKKHSFRVPREKLAEEAVHAQPPLCAAVTLQ